MEYLTLIGLLPALLINHIVYLCRPRAGINGRLTTAVPLVFVGLVASMWLASRVSIGIDVNMMSMMMWLQALVYAAMSSLALQGIYARKR